jgi:hypothetical protein
MGKLTPRPSPGPSLRRPRKLGPAQACKAIRSSTLISARGGQAVWLAAAHIRAVPLLPASRARTVAFNSSMQRHSVAWPTRFGGARRGCCDGQARDGTNSGRAGHPGVLSGPTSGLLHFRAIPRVPRPGPEKQAHPSRVKLAVVTAIHGAAADGEPGQTRDRGPDPSPRSLGGTRDLLQLCGAPCTAARWGAGTPAVSGSGRANRSNSSPLSG